MARIIKFTVEVSDNEFANFLANVSGERGHKVTVETDEPAPSESPDTDKNGVAWDERYHASSKALNADGTWRRKRGLSDEEAAAAEAYEKGGEAVVEAPDGTPVTMDLSTPAPGVQSVIDGADIPIPITADAPAPGLPTMPGLPTAAPAAPEPVSYEEVVKLYQEALGRNKDLDIGALYTEAGITDPTVLNTDGGAALRIELAKLLREA